MDPAAYQGGRMRLIALFLAALLVGCAQPRQWTAQDQYELQQILQEGQQNQNAIMNQYMQTLQRPAQPLQGGYQVQQPTGYIATWTGKQQIAQSVTGASGFSCEYNYAGRTFWRMFTSSCPSSIQVQ